MLPDHCKPGLSVVQRDLGKLDWGLHLHSWIFVLFWDRSHHVTLVSLKLGYADHAGFKLTRDLPVWRWILGLQLRSSCFCSKCFTDWVVSSALTFFFFLHSFSTNGNWTPWWLNRQSSSPSGDNSYFQQSWGLVPLWVVEMENPQPAVFLWPWRRGVVLAMRNALLSRPFHLWLFSLRDCGLWLAAASLLQMRCEKAPSRQTASPLPSTCPTEGTGMAYRLALLLEKLLFALGNG